MLKKKIKVGIIGLGYWGPNLVRNFNKNDDFEIVFCCDLRKERIVQIKKMYPFINVIDDYRKFLIDSSIELVAVATPPESHYIIGKEVIESGKHLFIEKPMTTNLEDALMLHELAQKYGKIVMVDHIFIFNGAIRKIKELIDGGELGDLVYYDSVRINFGNFQADVNVFWDLAIHDVYILQYLVGYKFKSVLATGQSHFGLDKEVLGFLHFEFINGFTAHLHVSWLSPVKIRRTIIAGTKKMLVYDDMKSDEKVKIYQKSVEINGKDENRYEMLVQHRVGDMYSPLIDASEPLQVAITYLQKCLMENSRPINDSGMGIESIRIMEAIKRSINTGQKILLENYE